MGDCHGKCAEVVHWDRALVWRLGQECQPFDQTPPTEQLFAPENIVIINNGL